MTPKDKIHRSKNKMNLIKGLSLYDSKLITTNNKGNVICIYFNGVVDTLEIENLNNDDQYIANNNYTIILKGKELVFSSSENRFQYNFK